MRPIRTIVTLSESTLHPKILRMELKEKAFEHQSLHLLLSHVHKPEQENYVADFSSFVGQTIKVEIEDLTVPEDESTGAVTFFEGHLTRASLVYEPGGLQLELEASSGSSKLDGIPKTRIFQDTTLQALLDEILGDYRGSGLDSTNISIGSLGNKKISFAAQWAENDWQFLLRLCRKMGLFLVARNRDLFIHSIDPWQALSGLDRPIDLILGRNLSELRLGLASAGTSVMGSSYQHFSEEGLDPGKGDQAEDVRVWTGPSERSAPTSALAQRVAGQSSGGSAEGLVVETDDHFSQQEFDAITNRWINCRIARMVRGEGQSDALGLGIGSLLHIAPAEALTFDALEGDRFLVTAATHTIEAGVYAIRFQICADGAPPLLDPAATSHEPDSRLLSATVVDATDPSNVGRVRIRFNPFSDEGLTDEIWVRCLTEASGQGHGTLNLPEIGDEVILALDPRSFAAPTVLGSVYSGAGKSLVADLPGYLDIQSSLHADNNIKYYLTKAGTCIAHATVDGAVRLVVATPTVSVTLSEADPASFDVQVDGGACQITGKKDGALAIKAKNITIEADEKITIKSGSAMKLDGGADVDVKAGGKMNLEASSDVNIKATQNLKVEAMQIEEKASMKHEIQGGMNLKMQAVKIDLN